MICKIKLSSTPIEVEPAYQRPIKFELDMFPIQEFDGGKSTKHCKWD